MQNNKGLQNNGTDSDELSNPLSAGKRNDGMQQLLSSLLCSRSQHHRDLMELKALQLHSTYLMQGIEAKPSI